MTTTQASAIVTRCGVDVTDEYTENIFNWTLDSGNIEADTVWNAAHAGMKSISLTTADLGGDLTGNVKLTCTLTASSATYGSVTVDDDMDASHTPGELDANDVFVIEDGYLKVTTSRDNVYVLENGRLKAAGAKLNGSITAQTKLFASQPEDMVEFSYDHNGLRTQKKVTKADGTVEMTEYTLHGKLVTHLTRGSDEMHFFYDAQSRPAMVEFNGTLYSYAHNLQGDIVGIIDSNGSLVVEYKYDAWGKPVVVRTLTTAYEKLAKLNPFRYREYVWDEEVECYYLRSRYYHPNRHRFINPDKYLPTEIFLCNNTFLYCSNQPTNCRDSDGCVPTDAEFHLRVQTAIITDTINGTSMFYEVPAVDSEGNTGRIDLFNRTTGEIWEVKKVTRPYSEAYDQLGGYLDMKIKDYNYDVIFKRGGPIAPGTTYLESSDGTKYAISYWYAGEGVIFYDVTIPEEQNRSIVDENSAGARIRRQNLLTKPDMTPDNTYIGLGLFGILAFALTGPALAGFASVTSSAAVIYLFPQILDKAA